MSAPTFTEADFIAVREKRQLLAETLAWNEAHPNLMRSAVQYAIETEREQAIIDTALRIAERVRRYNGQPR